MQLKLGSEGKDILVEQETSNGVSELGSTSALDERDKILFFESIYKRFQRAERVVGGPVDKYYRIGRDVIRLRFAGPALVPHFTPAFSHLESPPVLTPAFTICLWDSQSTKTALPILVRSLIDSVCLGWWKNLTGRKEIKAVTSDRIRTYFLYGPNILSMMDTSKNLGMYWLHDASATPYYEKAYPLTVIFNWWVEKQNMQCVHAAAVGTDKGGVLLPGKSGSGKSTTSLACLNSDLLYVSDDTSLVTCDPVPFAYSLYNTAKIVDFQHLPHLASLVNNTDRVEDEKGMIFLQKHFPEKIADGFPLKGILVPRITGKKQTYVKPTNPIVALKALAPSTLFQLPGAGNRAFQLMSQLVKSVPCYQLELGTDMQEIPKVILAFLQDREKTGSLNSMGYI